MAIQVQLRRGTATQNNAFTGAIGELSFDTTANQVRVHDGSTAGGFKIGVGDFPTGTNNIALGNTALDSLDATSPGGNNTAVGHDALTANTTASFNTAIGVSSGSLITTGQKNTIVGSFDGNEGGLDIRTANNHIVLSDGDGNPRLIIDNNGNVDIGGETTELKLKNTTHEDTSGGRESKITFQGEQSGGEQSVLAQIQASHHDASDDQKGELIFRTNDGSDGTSPTERMRIDSVGTVTITNASNDSQLILESTDADADSGPVLELFRNSASPADDDLVGAIEFHGENDADEKIQYGLIAAKLQDASDGTEDVRLSFKTITAGTERERITIQPSEVVINEDSQDLDFRVESNSNANMLFVDGGNNNVTMQSTSAGASTTPFVLHNASSNASTDVRMLLASCTTAADRPVILASTNNGSNACDFTVSTPNGGTPAERMRILGNGVYLVGKSADDNTSPGATFSTGGSAFVRSSAGVASFNRNGSDGTVVNIQHAGTTEGTISVSGSTVSYNGGHLARWSQLTDGSKDTSIVKGTVMTNLDQMAVWSHDAVEAKDAVVGDDGNLVSRAVEARDAYTEDNEQLNCMAVSSVEGDSNVAGVFVNWDDDDDEFNDMNVAMTGDMVIRIAKGVTIARGDLLMSAGDGTAKPQGDDIVRSKTIAKVTSTNVSHTYDDESYLVPCVVMAC